MHVNTSSPYHVHCTNAETEPQQAEWHQVCMIPKPTLTAAICTTVLQGHPGPGRGFIVVMVSRQNIAGMRTGPGSCRPLPAALLAAPVPGAPRHFCRSIILSGLTGSHYFTAVIIYSLTEPSACRWALTLMSLTAGQETHSGRINHQPHGRGAYVP